MRSYLYVPGNVSEKLKKAPERGADALIVDLVDGIPDEEKPAVRTQVATWLRTLPADITAWVRINPGPLGHDDARELVGPGLRGVCAAHTGSTIQLDALDAVLSTVEDEAGLPHRVVPVIPVLESAAALLNAPSIARAGRVLRLQLGEAALRAELGIEASPDERELTWVRSQVVVAGAAAGLRPPIGPFYPDAGDNVGLYTSSTGLRRLGYRGRTCLHPSQVATVNDVFTVRPL